jgi:Suppressor of fused protein (SUFU)
MNACGQARDALIEDKLGSLAEMERVPLPERLSRWLPNGDMYSLSESKRPGMEGRIVVTRGMADSSIGVGSHSVGRCGSGYELFIVSGDGSSGWAVSLLAYLMEWELTANIDLYGRVMEMGAVTIERIPLPTDELAFTSVLITSPWEAKQSANGEVLLLAVTLIFEDEMRWALRYGGGQLSALLREAGIGLVSYRGRSSVLTIPEMAEPLASLQMQGWFKKLNSSGIAEYILDEINARYASDWKSIVLNVDIRQNARLLVERPPRHISVEWSRGSSPPLLEGRPITDLPEVVRDLVELMNIAAARPGSLEDGGWQQVEMKIAWNDEEGQLKVDWGFDYPE